jgi:hypothetical protein
MVLSRVFFFRPENIGHFAMLLTGDRLYLQIARIFVWSGSFRCGNRAVSCELKHALKSRRLMYADDLVGVCFAEDVEDDLAAARRICVDLLGSKAIKRSTACAWI